jgi:hypothetical protein
MATNSICWRCSQSASLSNDDVIVAYSRTSCARLPGLLGCGTRTHATNSALPMSIAHTRSTSPTGSSVISSIGSPSARRNSRRPPAGTIRG